MSAIDRLTCEELFRRVDSYLDRELSDGEMRMVAEHLETCAACAAEYAFESSVLRNVRQKLAHIQAPPDLLSRISRRIAEAEGGQGKS